MNTQQTLFEPACLQDRAHLRDLKGRFATREQREFTIRESRIAYVERENTRLLCLVKSKDETIEAQHRLIEALRQRVLQISSKLRQLDNDHSY